MQHSADSNAGLSERLSAVNLNHSLWPVGLFLLPFFIAVTIVLCPRAQTCHAAINVLFKIRKL